MMYANASTAGVVVTASAAAMACGQPVSGPASGSSGSTLVAGQAPPSGPNPSIATPTRVSNNNVIFDPSVNNFLDSAMAGTAMCFCHRFLNPFGTTNPTMTSQVLVNPCLLHYCRVCNIQLNSCRQAKIHSEGKKHEKRLSYLKFCLESTDSTVSNPVAAAQPPNTAPAPVTQPPQPQPHGAPPNQSAVPGPAPPPAIAPTSTVYYGQSVQQPQVNYHPSAYYYPPVTQPAPAAGPPPPGSGSQPPTQQQPQPQPQQGYPMYAYSEYTSPPPANQVPTMMHMIDYSSIETSGNSAAGQMTGHSGHAPPPPAGNAHVVSQPSGQPGGQLGVPPQQQSGHGVMSPSLTSGFSGSGDCKSTETSSILSAASYSSGALNTSHNNYNYDQYYSTGSKQRNYYYPNNNYATWNYNVNYNNNYSPHHDHYTNSPGGNSTVNSETNINSKNNCNIPISNSTTNNNSSTSVFCDSCQIAFPSMAVLENHLKGSRHARRVKSQQAFRQLKDAGTLFRIRGSGTPVTELGMSSGAIRCEVCQVSVNSSHQLQAHLTGHKHRVRAIRRGVKTNQAVLSPSSSLLTSSTSVSEMSYTGTTSSLSAPPASNPNKKQKNKSETKSGGPKSASVNSTTGSKNSVSVSGRTRRSSVKVVSKKSSGAGSVASSAGSSAGERSAAKKSKQKSKQAEQQSKAKQSMALSRHRSSGCLQSRHCHSTLSLSRASRASRAKSSSALNRVQSRSMNLLMIQNNATNNNKHGMKSTSSDVLSMASTTSSSNEVDEEEEDEGVATDATGEGVATSGSGNGKINTAKKDIKSVAKRPQHRNIRINQEDGLAKEMAWMRLSNGQSTPLKTDENIIPNGTTHHEKKIFKRGFNVNAQEWKPTSMRRTSVGNASVKDIPMLDVFLQRLDRRHSSNNYSDSSKVGATNKKVGGNNNSNVKQQQTVTSPPTKVTVASTAKPSP